METKLNQPTEAINELLKTKINPTEINLGVNTFKSPSTRSVLIKTKSKEEIDKLETEINTKCEGELEENIHKMRKPRPVIFNIPEEICTKNLDHTLMASAVHFIIQLDEFQNLFARGPHLTSKINHGSSPP